MTGTNTNKLNTDLNVQKENEANRRRQVGCVAMGKQMPVVSEKVYNKSYSDAVNVV